MELADQPVRTGPRILNPEVHERILQLEIATQPHPSGILQRGGNVFPLVPDTDMEKILDDIANAAK